jgi:hypothetical protein
MAHASASTSTIGGIQGPPVPTNNNLDMNIYMMNVDAHLLTRTFMMLLACWKDISQPELSLTPTFLTNFDDHSFRPHGIIPSFPVQLGGKTMCVEVEVVDVPIDYNIFLGRSWTYVIHVMVATVFRVL